MSVKRFLPVIEKGKTEEKLPYKREKGKVYSIYPRRISVVCLDSVNKTLWLENRATGSTQIISDTGEAIVKLTNDEFLAVRKILISNKFEEKK